MRKHFKKDRGKKYPSKIVIIRYILLQIPGIFLLIMVLILFRQWLDIPTWLIWSFLSLWIAKDAILFPFVWQAYDQNKDGISKAIIGMRGIAKDRLAPFGYIQVKNELWKAELMKGCSPIDRGKSVRIHEIRGLTLLVQPVLQEKAMKK